MRHGLVLLFLLAGCAADMEGKWPSLAPRAGEVTADGKTSGSCPGCGQDIVAKPVPPPPPAPLPLPSDVEARLAAVGNVIAGVEAQVPGQARIAATAIAAAARDPARLGDAEVERSRFEALFLPLSIEERRLDVLADDIAGRAGSDAVAVTIGQLRARLAALQVARLALPAP